MTSNLYQKYHIPENIKEYSERFHFEVTRNLSENIYEVRGKRFMLPMDPQHMVLSQHLLEAMLQGEKNHESRGIHKPMISRLGVGEWISFQKGYPSAKKRNFFSVLIFFSLFINNL